MRLPSMKQVLCLGLILLISLSKSVQAAAYSNLRPGTITNSALKIQITNSSLSLDLDANPELKFRIRGFKSLGRTWGIRVYKSDSGEKGRLIAMRTIVPVRKAKIVSVDVPLNGIKELSEIMVEILNASGDLVNSYTTSITATSSEEGELSLFGGVEDTGISSNVFIQTSSVIHANGIEENDHFIFGSSQINDIEGTDDDNKLMFVRGSREGAFRAGHVTGDAWDLTNIGRSSVGIGTNAKASSEYAISIGNASQATGASGVAIGNSVLASGSGSFAIGNDLRSTHMDSVVIGSGNSAEDPLVSTADSSISIGFNSNAATMFIGASAGDGTSGRVGIGTSSPHSATKLDLNGPLKVREQGFLPTCDSSGKGMVTFYDNYFRGCNGSEWIYLSN